MLTVGTNMRYKIESRSQGPFFAFCWGFLVFVPQEKVIFLASRLTSSLVKYRICISKTTYLNNNFKYL